MTRQLFASAFTAPIRDAVVEPEFFYDEGRSLNLDAGGRPVVIVSAGSRTGTITEVRGESSDRDPQTGARVLGTITKTRGEGPDHRAALDTRTGVGTEPPDRQEGSSTETRSPLITETKAGGEPRDRHEAVPESSGWGDSRPIARRVIA